MSKRINFPLGAVPPPDFAWQVGKTAASISFVNQAQTAMAKLAEEIDLVKRGQWVLADYVDVRVVKSVRPSDDGQSESRPEKGTGKKKRAK